MFTSSGGQRPSYIKRVLRGAVRVYIGGGTEARKNRGTVLTSLQLAFMECVVAAMQGLDWL